MNRFFLLMLCFALFALTTCSDNLFGSSSKGNCGNDVKCLQMDAEDAFRNHDYKRAYDICSLVVSINPTISAGYFGMAKAGLWMNGVNPFDVFEHVKKDKGEVAFMDQPPSEQNRYLRGMMKAGPALRELARRDSLTTLYEFYRRNFYYKFDTTFIIKDSIVFLKDRLIKFSKDNNCDNELGVCPGFPLSDRVFRYNSYSGGLLISSISEKILKTMDTNNDSCIARNKPGCIAGKCNIKEYKKNPDQKECSCYGPGELTNLQAWANWGCRMKGGKYSYDLSINLVINEEGNFEIDLNQILDEIDDDYFRELENNPNVALPPEIDSLNANMDNFNNSMSEIKDIMDGFKNNTGEIPFNWEDNISTYNDYSTFYKVGTNIDEDGDGCIGEELMDGQDNDGDGLANGNARLVPIDWDNPKRFLLDGIDNSMAGIPEWNMPVKYYRYSEDFKHFCRCKERTHECCFIPGTPEDDTITVMRFTQEMPNYWTSQNREDKLRVAQDTICPPKISLEERKELIGGCWSNYTEEKFVKYWLKRGFARPSDREKRVHDTCKKCEGTACLRK